MFVLSVAPAQESGERTVECLARRLSAAISVLLRSDYAFAFNPSRIASGVMGMCRTRTPIAL